MADRKCAKATGVSKISHSALCLPTPGCSVLCATPRQDALSSILCPRLTNTPLTVLYNGTLPLCVCVYICVCVCVCLCACACACVCASACLCVSDVFMDICVF